MVNRLVINLFTLFIVLPLFTFSQGQVFVSEQSFSYTPVVDKSISAFLDSSSNYAALNENEKTFFFWTNYFRKQPKLFAKTILVPFLQQFPEVNNEYATSLLEDIKYSPISLPLLSPDILIQHISQAHCLDIIQNKNGELSHRSSSGKKYSERVSEFGTFNCISENLFSGGSSTLEALIFLLIDSGVTGVGHRKSLMNPEFTRMGASILPFRENLIIVQNLACK